MEGDWLLILPSASYTVKGLFMPITSEHVFLLITSGKDNRGCIICQDRGMSKIDRRCGSTLVPEELGHAVRN